MPSLTEAIISLPEVRNETAGLDTASQLPILEDDRFRPIQQHIMAAVIPISPTNNDVLELGRVISTNYWINEPLVR
jgi:hypothetical protein